MLIPKLRLHTEGTSDNCPCTLKYYVWNTEKNDYVVNGFFTFYEKKEECQEAIDWMNSLSVVKVS